jgi:hypothetical protein
MNADPSDVSRESTLVSGATGYVGGRLVPRLLAAGHRVRCLVRDPHDLRVGDALDFWRVEAVEPARLLRLRAEMKVPGRAWLQFETLPRDGGTLLVQTAYFAPKGLPGLLYWYSLYPVHGAIFSGMIAALAAEASRSAGRHGGVAPSSS